MTRIISKIPLLGRMWDHAIKLPFVRRSVEECKLALQYRSLFPDSVRLPNSHSPIFVDRRESRGRSVLLCNAQGQPNLKALWHQAITQIKPEVVLDIGANYGEFVFGERYPSAIKVLSVEANSALAPYLKKSHNKHPDRDKISILTALAAGRSDQEVEFFVDQRSSGRSTAVKRTDTVSVPTRIRTVAIDDLLSDVALEHMKVVFKIDVEGFEPNVFSGMGELIDRSRFVLGILEFNPKLIRLSGVEPENFLRDLHSRLQIIALPHHRPYYILREGNLGEIARNEGCQDFEIDLLVCTRTTDGSPEHNLVNLVIRT